jgi:AhpD family alkylhydroperoxidase
MSVPVVPTEPDWTGELIGEVEREFMAGPPLTLHLPVPALFAGVWAALRESLLAGPCDRAVREVIAATVSLVNKCPFCVDSHTAATSVLGDDGAAKAIRAGSVELIQRRNSWAAAQWAAATRTPGHPLLSSAPFAATDEPYAIGTALAFHYINRMVNTFLKPWPVTVPAVISRRPVMTRVNALFPGRLLGVQNLAPGASLRFCAVSRTVPELAKLDPAPAAARGWGALVATAEDVGSAVLSARTRAVVGEVIDAWDGSDPGLGWEWAHAPVSPLSQDEQASATLALTCALAAYRVDRKLVESVRRTHPADAQLVAIAAWASARATRRIASWI